MTAAPHDFRLYHSNALDVLAEVLADELRKPAPGQSLLTPDTLLIPPVAMRRFWTMLAHYHGQLWNASELARSMGLSDKTVRSYLDILAGTFMIRQLLPWHANLAKRQVKAPKVFRWSFSTSWGICWQRWVSSEPKRIPT